MRDKEWLKEEISKLSYTVTNVDGEKEYVGISKKASLNLIDQLEEPENINDEMISDILDSSRKLSKRNKELENQLEELQQEKPVVPQFVADWIEGNNQHEAEWEGYDSEDALNDSIHFTIYGLFANYPTTNTHVELRKPTLEWLNYDRSNYFKLVEAVRYGYTVEKEKLYRVKVDQGPNYLYVESLHLYSDVIKPLDFNYKFSVKENALKFASRNQAKGVAELVGGEVEGVTD